MKRSKNYSPTARTAPLINRITHRISLKKIKRIPIHGWLVVDKPQGMSSADVTNKIKWLTRAEKLGHGGTLDPMATGVLPIAFGEATKTIPFCMDARKSYRFTIAFGSSTDTDDAEGKTLKTCDDRPTLTALRDILPLFTGIISQIPPIYSALKVNGERAYDLARKGEDVTLAPREVTIYDIAVISHTINPLGSIDEATLEVSCSKGTYVRSLARDIALKLNTLGHVIYLRRLRVGQFHEKDTISLEKLEEIVHSAPPPGSLSGVLLRVEAALDDIPVLLLDDISAAKIHHGQSISNAGNTLISGMVQLHHNGRLLAIAQRVDGIISPQRVFNL
jgi:tRNA pseudouridine55 synthase